jgi:hypothetical protein
MKLWVRKDREATDCLSHENSPEMDRRGERTLRQHSVPKPFKSVVSKLGSTKASQGFREILKKTWVFVIIFTDFL